ncbi:MAG: hypothetical protein HN703_07710 [Planctomycetaceae bacterium]|nr:hypothetical protein [Planctomycetaceae bacterium]
MTRASKTLLDDWPESMGDARRGDAMPVIQGRAEAPNKIAGILLASLHWPLKTGFSKLASQSPHRQIIKCCSQEKVRHRTNIRH